MTGTFFSEEIETMPLNDMRELQLKRLKWVVDHAYRNNSTYNARFKEAGVSPDDIKSLDDITKLPVLAKEDLRETYPFGLTCTPSDSWVELHSSSGTTGKPVVKVYTQKDIETWSEVMARGLFAGGMRASDRMQCAYGLGLFTGGFGFYYGAMKLGAMTIPTSSGNTKRQILLMKDFGSTALGATPSYGLYLAEVAKEMGFDPANDFDLKMGFFGAEAWSEEIRTKLEDAWGDFTAHEAFGLTEVGGPGTSFDCKERCGLHINSDHYLVECVDEEMQPVAPGEEGELIITTLTHEGFPAIRFRTKDLSKIEEDACACGRHLARHSRILGRRDDMMKIKGVITFPKQIEEAILSVEGSSENYQIIKFKAGVFTDLKVEVEPTTERFAQGSLDQLSSAISAEIQSIIGLRLGVEIVPPGTIPRSEGKAKRVIDMTGE